MFNLNLSIIDEEHSRDSHITKKKIIIRERKVRYTSGSSRSYTLLQKSNFVLDENKYIEIIKFIQDHGLLIKIKKDQKFAGPGHYIKVSMKASIDNSSGDINLGIAKYWSQDGKIEKDKEVNILFNSIDSLCTIIQSAVP